MKIAHLCLSNFYIDGYAYQENELIRQNVADGHEVVVIASTESFNENRELTYVEAGMYVGEEGAKVIRVPYRKWLPHAVMKKIRMHPNVYKLIEVEAPEVILFHSLCGWELLTIRRYKKKFPAVRIYADSHEDFNNSARFFLSKYLLHGIYYRTILRHSLCAIKKIFCVSIETINFVHDFYGVPFSKIEFWPLGGRVFDDNEYVKYRNKARSEYLIGKNEILFVQTGKMDRSKKVIESLRSFSKINTDRHRYVLAGHLHEDVAAQVEAIIQSDNRIRFVGWKSPDELRELLCAADVYVQPGTQSATMQMSLCARCAVVVADVPSHHPFVKGNGWLLGGGLNLDKVFREISDHADQILEMSKKSSEIAALLLDYRKLAARLYS
jgi:1,2-diacylglycerol 3-alpha-glucosyltransferase